MADLIELAERVEKAEGADRGIDYKLACWYNLGAGVPEYTASIDAAMSLVPDNTGWAHWSPIGKWPSVAIETDAGWGDWHSARTLPLALVSAALRARSAATL